MPQTTVPSRILHLNQRSVGRQVSCEDPREARALKQRTRVMWGVLSVVGLSMIGFAAIGVARHPSHEARAIGETVLYHVQSSVANLQAVAQKGTRGEEDDDDDDEGGEGGG
jgi:hypothetical protein